MINSVGSLMINYPFRFMPKSDGAGSSHPRTGRRRTGITVESRAVALVFTVDLGFRWSIAGDRATYR